MQSENELRKIEIPVRIDRRNDSSVYLLFSELECDKINLSDSGTDDITNLYNAIFDYIINNKVNIKFILEDKNTDLFFEVTDDLVKQMNSELLKSEEKLIEVINLIRT